MILIIFQLILIDFRSFIFDQILIIYYNEGRGFGAAPKPRRRIEHPPSAGPSLLARRALPSQPGASLLGFAISPP